VGTTVSSNIGLIKPDADESIREDLPTFPGWAAQNALNMDKIDSLFRATSHSYTPAWTASTLNPTLGAGGSITGKYIRLWPRMVLANFRIFTGGAGFATGTGSYRISLPTSVAAELVGELPVGKLIFMDASAVLTCSTFLMLFSSATNTLFGRATAATTWSTTGGVVPAQNDRFSGYALYPTSDA
jgi:hypothetical protein